MGSLLLGGVLIACFVPPQPAAVTDDWPQWRGPANTGVAPDATPPVTWSETQNVRWKTELPGRGHSTPIIHGPRIYVTAAIGYGPAIPPPGPKIRGAHDNLISVQRQKFSIIAIDRQDGKIAWQRVVLDTLPLYGGHNTASLASPSPVTNGDVIIASFGSQGLYAVDTAGSLVWQRSLGTLQIKHAHGEGSSPALYGNTLIVNWDHEGDSFVAALDARTGKELWRQPREEVTSWSTPIIVTHAGRQQVIVCGTNRVRGYDLKTGNIIWECGGLSANIVASPVAADGVVYAGSSYDSRAFLAIRLQGAKGDISGSDNVLWRRIHGTPYVPSPLLYDGVLYFLRHYQSVLSRVNAATGEDQGGPFRLPGVRNIYASPVAAAERVYITGLNGRTVVLSHADEPALLAQNQLDDSFSASAAIAGDAIYLRGERYLYCLAEDGP